MMPTNSTIPSILIVDDTPQNLQLAGEALSQDLSCEISFATSGNQALVTARELLPDLILLDVMMPDIDGFEVCRQLKVDARTASIPVIFLTALVEVEDLVKGFQVGGADYVTKPFKRPELVTRVRTQLQALEAQRTIKQKNEELGQLMQILCHDLANPVSAIYSLLDLIGDDAETFLEFKSDLTKTTEMTLDLIRMVKEMRRLEESNGTLNLQKLRLQDSIDSVLHVLKERIREKQISLQVDVPSELFVKAEPISFVHSVLANLLTNAVKFSPRGSEVRVEATPLSARQISIRIMDQGIGMKPEMVDTLFEPGFHTHRQGTELEPGTGYGMHLVKKFIDAYGGDIVVDSRERQMHPESHGTTIVLYLGGGAENSPKR